MKKTVVKLIALPVLILAGFFLQAQNSLDLQRYSQYSAVGTAKTVGMGGATSVIGADWGSTLLNPAGVAFYRKSEFGISPAFRNFTTKTEFIAKSGNASQSNFGFSNFHFVFGKEEEEDNGVRGWGLGIGYNQIDNFYRRTEVSAFNEFNSIADFYVMQAGNTSIQNLDTTSLPAMAYYLAFIDTSGADNYYIPVVEGNMQQTYSRKETGRLNSWDFNLGLNFNSKLYFGIALGLVDLKYTSSEVHKETDTKNLYQVLTPDLDKVDILSFEQRYQFKTTGVGVNGKFGMIFRPVDQIRIGLGLQTPTAFNLSDSYQVGMTMIQDNGAKYDKEGPEGLYQYKMKTPFRATLGLVYQIGKVGMISFDADYLDYSQANLSDKFTSSTFVVANSVVSQLGNAQALNFRVGGEIRNDVYYGRAGYGIFSSFWNAEAERYDDLSTYNPNTYTFQTKSFNSSRQLFTLGFGYRPEDFSFDIAILYQMDNLKYNLYEIPVNAAQFGWGVNPVILQKRTQIGFVMTFGIKL